MFLKSIYLQNFRNYAKSEFSFSKGTTLVVGPNTSGKTNLIEAIFFLSTGKSFRSEQDERVIQFGKEISRVSAEILLTSDTTNNQIKLEFVIANGVLAGKEVHKKKYLVNGVPKRRIDFVGNMSSVLFAPSDLDMIVGSPSLRRGFLNNVLETTDTDYRRTLLEFTKALRQRNALLERVRETGVRQEKQFEYWDSILIQTGGKLTQKREKFIEFINRAEKDIFDFVMLYDKSVISKERLLQHQVAEIGAGVTLVGPHRDDFSVQMFNNKRQATHDIKFFGSRGQQRLVVLQLKLLEFAFIEENFGERPILLLDDIFSELDSDHINLVLDIINKQQTIVTTTHKEFIPKKVLDKVEIIELEER